MKKTIIILFAAAVAVTAIGSAVCCASNFSNCFIGQRLKGSGHLVTRTIELPAFHEVEASNAVEVFLTDKETKTTVIEADDNVIDYVVVRVEQGELKIGIDRQIESTSNIHVKVTVPTDGKLRELKANSAAEITGNITVTGPELELDASSAGRIDIKAEVTKCKADASSAARISADVKAAECEAEASSASTIELKGTANRCDVEVSSAASFCSPNFVVAAYRVEASSDSKAVVHCTATLEAHASSGASIRYSGNCQLDRQTSSGGSVHKK